MRVACHDYNWIPYARQQGEKLSLERVLAEVAEAGYDAVEFSKHPMELDDPAATARHLDKFGLKLTGMTILFKGEPGELEQAKRHARILADLGGDTAVFFDRIDWGEGGTALPGPYRSTVELADAFAEFAASLGLDTTFHNHLGTNLETAEQIDEVMGQLTRCGLCLDTGHLIAAGGDPVLCTRKHAAAIRYVHFKDCALKPDGTIEEFVELGTGNSPHTMDDALAVLREVGYDGWLVLEQDQTRTTPRESARANREFMRKRGL